MPPGSTWTTPVAPSRATGVPSGTSSTRVAAPDDRGDPERAREHGRVRRRSARGGRRRRAPSRDRAPRCRRASGPRATRIAGRLELGSPASASRGAARAPVVPTLRRSAARARWYGVVDRLPRDAPSVDRVVPGPRGRPAALRDRRPGRREERPSSRNSRCASKIVGLVRARLARDVLALDARSPPATSAIAASSARALRVGARAWDVSGMGERRRAEPPGRADRDPGRGRVSAHDPGETSVDGERGRGGRRSATGASLGSGRLVEVALRQGVIAASASIACGPLAGRLTSIRSLRRRRASRRVQAGGADRTSAVRQVRGPVTSASNDDAVRTKRAAGRAWRPCAARSRARRSGSSPRRRPVRVGARASDAAPASPRCAIFAASPPRASCGDALERRSEPRRDGGGDRALHERRLGEQDVRAPSSGIRSSAISAESTALPRSISTRTPSSDHARSIASITRTASVPIG